MKNVTISMDEELIQLLRVESAKAGKSMSKYVGHLVEKALNKENPVNGEKNEQLAAVKRILARPKWNLTTNGKMPTADERNSRG